MLILYTLAKNSLIFSSPLNKFLTTKWQKIVLYFDITGLKGTLAMDKISLIFCLEKNVM
jgi:hypothetical protein